VKNKKKGFKAIYWKNWWFTIKYLGLNN
jgi:hypothetical protein